MRGNPVGRLAACALAIGLLAPIVASAAPAVADTGNPLDIGPVIAGPPPSSYPARFFGYHVRPDATNWGWNEQVLPVGLADGRGQNSASAAIASACIPAVGEEPKDTFVAVNQGLLEGSCKLHAGSATFNVGVAHRGKNRDGNTFSTGSRRAFIRYSRTNDCLSPTVEGVSPEVGIEYRDLKLDAVVGLGDSTQTLTRQIPVTKVGQYLCIAQGHTGQVLEASSVPVVGVDEVFSWHVRGPWTVFKVVGTNDSDTPTDLSVTAGNGEALVYWQYPNAQLAATTFTVTSIPDGRTCMVVGAKRCLVTGLRNGVSYVFTVKAERGALRATSGASPAATPTDPNASAGAGNVGANAGGNAAAPLGAVRPAVVPVNADVIKPLGMVEVTARLSGAPAAGQRITARSVLACFVANRGDACGNAKRVLELRPTIDTQKVRVWIPSAAAGMVLRVTQSVGTSTGRIGSVPLYSAISRESALGAARVDAPAGADPNAIVPQQAGDVAAVPDGNSGAAAPDAAASAPAGDAAAGGVAATGGADPGAAGAAGAGAAAGTPASGGVDPAQAARTAGVDLDTHPIAAGSGPSMALAASSKVNRGRFISMKAVMSPKATGGRVRLALVRVTPKGAYVSSKSIYAPVKAGVATKRWRIPRSYTPAKFMLVASYEPKGGGVGATRTAPVTIG